MKNTLIILFLALATVVIVSSCKHKHGHDHDHTHDQVSEIDKSGKEYTSAYVCPMHCEGSGSATEGTCPVCKMDYVKNKKTKSGNSHQHDGHNHDHSGHDHSGHDQNHDH